LLKPFWCKVVPTLLTKPYLQLSAHASHPGMLPRRCPAVLPLLLLSAIRQVACLKGECDTPAKHGMVFAKRLAHFGRGHLQRDQREALKAFHKHGLSSPLLQQRIEEISKLPITVNFPITSFNSKTFTEGPGLVNKDVALEEAWKTSDEELIGILATNHQDRSVYYEQRGKVEDSIAQEELSNEDRPVYGSLDLPGTIEVYGEYGEIQLVLRPEVWGRVTVTAGDSHDLSLSSLDTQRVQVATKDNLYPLFTDTSSHSYSEQLRTSQPAMVEAQIWGGPVDFDKDVDHLRLSHAGVTQIVKNHPMPLATKKERRAAYGRLFDKIKNFANKHGKPFQDEHGKAWTKTDFQDDLDEQMRLVHQIMSDLMVFHHMEGHTRGVWRPA